MMLSLCRQRGLSPVLSIRVGRAVVCYQVAKICRDRVLSIVVVRLVIHPFRVGYTAHGHRVTSVWNQVVHHLRRELKKVCTAS